MTAQHETSHRNPAAGPAAGSRQAGLHDHGTVENSSIRVLIETNSVHRCEHCNEVIGEGTRYRCLTVRDDQGTVEEYAYCDGECVLA
ncbi:MAG: hypothetical protein V5A43_06280 [Haloarculaceae archaeon]